MPREWTRSRSTRSILRLGLERHPDRPYADPRVTRVTDDARHFLRTTEAKYDLVVFALIDSLTLQSSFAGVRLESYMFTEESFRAVRDRLKPDGLLVIYNYFREPWLVDRLANTAAEAFGEEPRVHVHEARAYLGVLMAGPRLRTLASEPRPPDRVTAFGQSHEPSPARVHHRDAAIEPARDDWPFLYLRDRHVPRHYLVALALILVVSVAAVIPALRISATVAAAQSTVSTLAARIAQMFLLGAGFMMLETKSIIQFALLWGSTWVVASLAIASVLVMALAATLIVSTREIRRPWVVGGVLLALLGVELPDSDRHDRLREPRRGVGLLCRARVQPDPVRRVAVRVGDQAVAVARARLRRQPPGGDGGWSGGVSVARDGLPRAAGGDRGVLRRCTAGARPLTTDLDYRGYCSWPNHGLHGFRSLSDHGFNGSPSSVHHGLDGCSPG